MTPASRPRVKICGLTRRGDAELAVSLGADAIGFILWPSSPRATTAAAAGEIGRGLGALVTRVGVFVNPSRDEVARAIDRAALDVVQLHGDEDVRTFAGLPARLMKAVAMADDTGVRLALDLPPDVTVLADAPDAVRRGGTGQRADWPRAALVAKARPLVLAGGVRADTVADALRLVRPWGIDVSSGVEDAPGVKSEARMRALFAAVAAASEGL